MHKSSALLDMAGVLIKKQIRVSPKSGNKYAFLQLSDSSGVYEVMMFSEGLAAARDILNEGESFLLKVIAESKEEQIRYTCQSIRPLDAALVGKIEEVHIYLDNDKPISQLQQLLQQEGQGRSRIFVNVPINENRMASIELDGRYRFSAEARNALLRSEGVAEIKEV